MAAATGALPTDAHQQPLLGTAGGRKGRRSLAPGDRAWRGRAGASRCGVGTDAARPSTTALLFCLTFSSGTSFAAFAMSCGSKPSTSRHTV